MPRRKPQSEEQTENPVLMLPTPRVVHHREHEVDAYQAPAGAVPVTARATNVSETTKRTGRKMTKADRQQRDAALSEQRERADRYDAYLDAMADTGLDEVKALARVYELTEDAARLQIDRLRHDVRLGIGSSSVAHQLERNDLNEVAQIRRLRGHVYSDNPAASLKALDMVREMTGTRGELGSFEQYLKLAKAQKG